MEIGFFTVKIKSDFYCESDIKIKTDMNAQVDVMKNADINVTKNATIDVGQNLTVTALLAQVTGTNGVDIISEGPMNIKATLGNEITFADASGSIANIDEMQKDIDDGRRVDLQRKGI